MDHVQTKKIDPKTGPLPTQKNIYAPPRTTYVPLKQEERMMGCGKGAAKVVCAFGCK